MNRLLTRKKNNMNTHSSFITKVNEGYYNNNLEKFKNDMFECYNVSNHPKADKAYSLAWEYGHSAGLHDIHNYFSDLVELIK